MGNQSLWGLPPLVSPSGSVPLTADWKGKVVLMGRSVMRWSSFHSHVYVKVLIVVLRLKAVHGHNHPKLRNFSLLNLYSLCSVTLAYQAEL